MRVKLYNARFIGTTSCGYQHGKIYSIFVQQQSLWRQFRVGWSIEIWTHPDTGGSWVPYESLHSFLANWQILESHEC